MAKPDCSELSIVITDMAMKIGEQPGMDSLAKVTVAMNKALADATVSGEPRQITRSELVDYIVEATATHRDVLDEAKRQASLRRVQVARLKREAKVSKHYEEANKELERMLAAGETIKGVQKRDFSSEVVKQYRKVNAALKKALGPSDLAKGNAEIKKVAGLRAKLAKAEQHLREATVPAKAEKARDKQSEEVEALKAELRAAEKAIRNSLPALIAKQVAANKRLADKLESVQHVPPVPKGGTLKSKELDKLVFEGTKTKRAIRAKIRSLKPQTVWSRLATPANAARKLMTSLDFSAVLRQGGFVVLGNPVRGIEAARKMFIAAKSEQDAQRVNDEIQARYNAPLYDSSGLFLAPLDETDLSKQEEAFLGRVGGYVDKLPGVLASQRAYVTFLNQLRADSFDAMVETLSVDGEVKPEEAKVISNYINVATGRGSLGGGNIENAGPALATVFFAPRLVASRFQLIYAQPFFGANARTRKLIAAEYGKFILGLGVVALLGIGAGGEWERDPRSSDFGKLKFGRTRVDLLSGISQVTVFVGRVVTGEKKSSNTGRITKLRGEDIPFGSDTEFDVITRFVRSKFSPLIGAGINIIEQQNVVGEPATVLPQIKDGIAKRVSEGRLLPEEDDALGEVVGLMVPLSIRDVQESLAEHGIPKATALSLLSIFGLGVQTYGARLKPGHEDLGKALNSLTAPSAGPEGFDKLGADVTYENAKEALKTHARAKAAKAKRKGRRQRIDFTSKAFRARLRKLREGLASRK